MNRRLPAIIAALVIALAAVGVLASLTRGGSVASGPVQHRIDLVANVTNINFDTGCSMQGTTTSGFARFVLDDLRVLIVAPGTNVADHDIAPVCTDLATPKACVLLADMLGEAIVWFALVPAGTSAPLETLELPGIVDMQANGDEGVFSNGWVMTLATPTKRICKDNDTSSLRDFITRYPGTAARSIVDLTTDRIVRVECKG